DRIVLQLDRLQGTALRHFEQRSDMGVLYAGAEADVRLDRRPAEMSVEDCLRGLEPNALVFAVQQFAQALHSARGQLTQRSLDLFRDARPAARIGTAAGEPVSARVAFHHDSPILEGHEHFTPS